MARLNPEHICTLKWWALAILAGAALGLARAYGIA